MTTVWQTIVFVWQPYDNSHRLLSVSNFLPFIRHTCVFWSSYMHVPLRNMFFSPSECTCAIHPSCALCGTNALLHCCILRVLLRHACVMRHCGPSQAHARIHLPTQPTASSLQSDLPPPHLGAIRCWNCSSEERIVDIIKIFMFESLALPCAKTELRNDNFSVQRKPLI